MAYNLTGLTVVNGTSAAETLSGGNANEAVYGNGGADTLSGGRGKDIIFGGSPGVTFLYTGDATWGNFIAANAGDPGGAGPGTTFSLNGYGRSYDVFVGVGTSNTLVMPNGKNALFLEDSISQNVHPIRLVNIQSIVLGSGGQIVDLTSSTVSYGAVGIEGGSGNDVIMTSSGADTIDGGDGSDYIWGGSGSDALTGGAGNDTILGANGDDMLDGGAGNDSMTGGLGNDTYVVGSSGDVVVEAAGQGSDIVLSTVSHTLGANLERLTLLGSANILGNGNTLDNVITGNSGSNFIDAKDGNDSVSAGDGNDTVIGGNGNDTIDGGAGTDSMVGGQGNDTYTVDSLSDVIVEAAGEGTDFVYASVNYTMAANLEVLTLTGTAGLTAAGNALDNTINGNAGNNYITGGDGLDRVNAGNGHDTIIGGNGNDNIFAAHGNDRLFGDDGIDNLNGGAGNDSIVGGAGNDGLWGGGGIDVLIGEAGNDKLYGDGGHDTITGGAGNDWMYGGQLNGRGINGNDTFAWSRTDIVNGAGTRVGFDQILDFNFGDKLDFSAVFAGGTALPLAQRVAVRDSANGTIISVHVDGVTGFLDTVLLRGVHGETLASLAADGAFIV